MYSRVNWLTAINGVLAYQLNDTAASHGAISLLQSSDSINFWWKVDSDMI